MFARPGVDGLNLLEGIDASAAAVVRVLQADQPRAYLMIVVRPNLVLQLRHVEDAVIAVERPAGDAAEHRRAAGLVVVNVAIDIAEQLVAGLRVRLDADLVRHGARRHEQGRFLAEQFGDAFFQAVDGGVFVEDVVADLGGVHGRAHAGRRPGHGVAAQIDQWFRHDGFLS